MNMPHSPLDTFWVLWGQKNVEGSILCGMANMKTANTTAYTIKTAQKHISGRFRQDKAREKAEQLGCVCGPDSRRHRICGPWQAQISHDDDQMMMDEDVMGPPADANAGAPRASDVQFIIPQLFQYSCRAIRDWGSQVICFDGWWAAHGDGMQTAALADCERLRTNMRHA